MAYFIGIDAGTSSVKAAVLENGRAAACRVLYPAECGGKPTGWYAALREAVGRVARDAGPGCLGLGLTAQVGTYILSRDDEGPEGWPVYGWGGPGGSAQREALQARHGTAFFIRHTGMPLPMVNSYPPARLRWLMEEKPEQWARCRRVLAPKDYLYHCLTGRCFSDFFSWNALSRPGGSPSPEFLDALGLDAALLPPMYGSFDAPAGLSAKAAAELGLPEGTPVFLGCNDAHASLAGMGVCRLGQAFDLTGTSEHVGRIAAAPQGDGELVCSPFFEGFCNFGVTASSGPSIDWGLARFPSEERLLLGKYEAVLSGEARPPVFLPYLCGERSPIWDGDARGAFIGLSDAHENADLLYGVLEGVVFSVYHIWSTLPPSLTAGVSHMRLGGGAADNAFLNRMKADLLGLTLEIPEEKNAGALGAGLIAAVGAGAYPDLTAAAAKYVRLRGSVAPGRVPEALLRRFDLYHRLSGINRGFGVAEGL